jgi:hypothetical protein
MLDVAMIFFDERKAASARRAIETYLACIVSRSSGVTQRQFNFYGLSLPHRHGRIYRCVVIS